MNKMTVYKAAIGYSEKAHFDQYSFYKSILGNSDLDIQYKIGDTYYPEIGGLFGFKKLEDAMYFVGTKSTWYILVGIGTNVRPVKYMSRLYGDYKGLCKFWQDKKNHKAYNKSFVELVPRGTVIMDSFEFVSVYTKYH